MEPTEPTEDEAWAWAAGLFEGEGSIVGSPRGARLSVHMTDEDVLRRLQSIVGGRVYGPYQYEVQADGSVRKPAWTWLSDGADAGLILRRWLPWLGARRRERAVETGLLRWSSLDEA